MNEEIEFVVPMTMESRLNVKVTDFEIYIAEQFYVDRRWIEAREVFIPIDQLSLFNEILARCAKLLTLR